MNLKNCAHKKLNRSQICGICEAPQGWTEFAQCALDDPDLLFPEETDPVQLAKAKKICSNCPVKGFCLELGWLEDFGIWAGFSTAERKRLRKTFNLKDKSIKEQRTLIRTIAYRLI
jgi:hypothetical protein